jgi:hypothetical protein
MEILLVVSATTSYSNTHDHIKIGFFIIHVCIALHCIPSQ